jgi:hypothetical protein
MRNNILFFLFILTTVSVLGQQEQKLTSFNLEGQIAATTDGKGVFVNFGGPTLKFNFDKVTFGINFMPSLRFQEDKVKALVTPTLGFGPQLYLLKNKKFILSFPAYYNTNTNVWTFTAGLGYVLTTKKK